MTDAKVDRFKECPACAEWIREKALVCRYCGAILTDGPLPPFLAREQQKEENELDASVQERFGQFGLELSHAQKRRIVEFLKSSEDQYRSGTVMFADITSYTKLCQELAPEYVHEIVKAYYAIFSSTVELYNGFVVEFAGDGALAVFGAPMAFERDVEAALRAALDIRQRIRSLPPFQGRRIAISAGLATGEILAAIVRETSPPHYKIIGPAVNLAARVQSSAESDTIVIDDQTHDLVSSVFDFIPRPPRDFKNVNRPVPTFVVQGIRASGVARRTDEVPFVGRDRELGTLLDAFRGWNNGASRAPLIVTGEAGIGKSRLIANFLGRIREHAVSVRTESSPFEQRIPYGLWRAILSAILDLDPRLAPGEIGQRLDAWLALNGFAHGETHPLKLVFGMSEAVEGPLASLPPRTVFRLVCADLYRALETTARHHARPLVIALDDLQWADRTSLDALHLLATEQNPSGAFFILSHRSDFELPGTNWPAPGALHLQSLDEDARRALFSLLADARELLPAVRDRLLQQAEGNPLFLVEFFSNLGRHGGAVTGDSIPPSLRQMIQARIDALDDRRKAVLQAASVLGRRFSVDLLRIYDHVREDLLARLYALKTARHLQDDPGTQGLHFYFRQNLTREVSYSSLLQKRRREFHLIVAEYLEDQEGPIDGDRIQLLAYHFQHAESDRKASHYLELSGDRARSAGAVAEARESYEAALLCLRRLRRTADSTLREISILRSLGILARYAGDPTRARGLNGEALALAEQRKLRPIAADLRHLAALIDANSGQARQAEQLLPRVLAEARRLHLAELEAKTLNVLGVCAWNRGDIHRAANCYQRCLERLGRTGSTDLRADLLSNLGLIAWKRGRLSEAGRLLDRSIAARRKSGNRFGMALALMNRGIIRENEGAAAAARRLYTQALDIARRIHFLQVEAACLANLANLSLGLDRPSEALAFSSQALDSALRAGDHRSEAIARENLALAHIGLRQFEHAARELQESAALAKATSDQERLLSLRLAECELALRRGSNPPSIDTLENLVRELGEASLKAELPRAHRLWAETLAAADQTTRARKQLATALRAARSQSNRVEERRVETLAQKLKP